jgi:hypothetical protein
MNSKWRFGCGKKVYVYNPPSYKEREVECGSTAYDGNVNQCSECEEKHSVSPVRDDEGDMEWFERQED